MQAFRVIALDAAQFQHLFGKSDAELAALGASATTAGQTPGYPCRVSLRDAPIGARMILLNFEHLSGDTPYRSRYAIYIGDGAESAAPEVNEVPEYLARRLLSIRAFDRADRLCAAEVAEGRELRRVIDSLFANPDVRYLHVHNAREGCYLARIDRA